MSKTPEEMAKEYCSTSGWLEDDYVWRETEAGFLAGYEAAKKLYAAKLQEANDTIDGMVDECEGLKTIICDNEQTNLPTPAKWISVKDRLPEENELCIVNTEWRGIVFATYGNESWIFDEGQGWSEKALSYASHWMELPAPPKEEKLITSLDQIHRPQKRISVEEAREMFPDKPPKEEK